jgi:hypothetical protein
MPDSLRRTPLDWTVHPPYLHPPYGSTVKRAPALRLVPRPATLSEVTGPVFGPSSIGPLDHDLTKNAVKTGEPIGERIIVAGRVLDDGGASRFRGHSSRFGRPMPAAATSISSTSTTLRSIPIFVVAAAC